MAQNLHQTSDPPTVRPLTARDGMNREHWPETRASSTISTRMTAIAVQEVDFFVPDSNTDAHKVFMTSVTHINQADEDDTATICALYGSAVTCFFPDLEGTFKGVLQNVGYSAQDLKLPSRAGENNIEMAEDAYYSKCLILMGQLVLVPFKNMSNHDQFILCWVVALKALVGVRTCRKPAEGSEHS